MPLIIITMTTTKKDGTIRLANWKEFWPRRLLRSGVFWLLLMMHMMALVMSMANRAKMSKAVFTIDLWSIIRKQSQGGYFGR